MKSRWQRSSKQVGIDSDGGGTSGRVTGGRVRRIKGGTRLALTSCRAYLSVNLYLRAYVPPFKHSGRRDESWTREIQRMRLAMCQLVFNLWLPPRATGRADSPSLPLPVLLSVCRHYIRNLDSFEITLDPYSYAWNVYRQADAMKGKSLAVYMSIPMNNISAMRI